MTKRDRVIVNLLFGAAYIIIIMAIIGVFDTENENFTSCVEYHEIAECVFLLE